MMMNHTKWNTIQAMAKSSQGDVTLAAIFLWPHLQNENKNYLKFQIFHSIGENGGISIFLSEVIEFICRLVGYNLGVQVNSRIEFD